MGVGISEIFLILLVALLLFGAKGLPDIARTLGKALREFKKATEDIKKEISQNEIIRDIKDVKEGMQEELKSNQFMNDVKDLKNEFMESGKDIKYAGNEVRDAGKDIRNGINEELGSESKK